MDSNHSSSIEYSEITDHVFLGTNACCQIHFDEGLLKKGVTADISMESERLDAPWGVKCFLWLPTVDHTAPSIRSLVLGAQMIAFLVNQKEKVYVHCKNGHGRAPTMVAAYLISTGKTVKQAIRIIAKGRPEIHIEPIQEKILEKFTREVTW